MKAPKLEFLFNKISAQKVCNFIEKETPTQALSCEKLLNFKNIYFEKDIRERLLRILREKLLNSFSRVLNFNECL